MPVVRSERGLWLVTDEDVLEAIRRHYKERPKTLALVEKNFYAWRRLREGATYLDLYAEGLATDYRATRERLGEEK